MHIRSLSAAVALLLVGTLASGCRKQAAAAEQTPAAQAQPPKPVPETLPDVVARVNGEDVTKKDFEKLIAQLEMQAGGTPRGAAWRRRDRRLGPPSPPSCPEQERAGHHPSIE